MTRPRKKKNRIIHSSTLQPSIRPGRNESSNSVDLLLNVYRGLRQFLDKFPRQSWDLSLLEGSFVVQERFLDLTESYIRIRGVSIPISDDTKAALVLWRTMYGRFIVGDFRHTEDERRALADVAQWTLEEQAKLRNQDPPAKLD